MSKKRLRDSKELLSQPRCDEAGLSADTAADDKYSRQSVDTFSSSLDDVISLKAHLLSLSSKYCRAMSTCPPPGCWCRCPRPCPRWRGAARCAACCSTSPSPPRSPSPGSSFTTVTTSRYEIPGTFTCSYCWAGLGPGAERDYIVLLLCLPTLASVLVLLALASAWRRAHGLQHPATAAILCILLVSIPSPIFL